MGNSLLDELKQVTDDQWEHKDVEIKSSLSITQDNGLVAFALFNFRVKRQVHFLDLGPHLPLPPPGEPVPHTPKLINGVTYELEAVHVDGYSGDTKHNALFWSETVTNLAPPRPPGPVPDFGDAPKWQPFFVDATWTILRATLNYDSMAGIFGLGGEKFTFQLHFQAFSDPPVEMQQQEAYLVGLGGARHLPVTAYGPFGPQLHRALYALAFQELTVSDPYIPPH